MGEARARTVLIVTREAPPSIGPHPIRVAKLAKYLPAFGWRPVILTVPIDHAWTRDPELLDDLGRAEVVRVPRLFTRLSHPTGLTPHVGDSAAPRVPHQPRLRRAVGAWAIPDASLAWAIPAAWRAMGMAHRVEAILTTAPPFSTHLVGLVASRRHATPWVAEYRDNWTVNPLYSRSSLVNGVNRQLESRILHAATRIVVVSDAAAAELGRDFPFAAGRICVAENGYDPDDLPPDGGSDRTFTIAYVGSLDERRDPTSFLAALRQASELEPGLAEDVRLHLMGNVAGWVTSAANETLGAQRVTSAGLLRHREALANAAAAAVLLGITTSAEAGAAGTTSKLFEYLGLRRPILMLAPRGPAATIVERLGAGVVAPPDDVEAIVDAIVTLYQDWRGGRQRTASEDALARYTRAETARRVAAALDEAAAAR